MANPLRAGNGAGRVAALSSQDFPRRRPLLKHIANIRTSGTIVSSSRFLVRRLLGGIDFTSARHIVELGVGTGCVTREILRRMRPDARLISLEVNPAFAEVGRRIRDPRFTLRIECASHLLDILREEQIDDVDAVVSSLPLRIMDELLVDRILDASRAALSTAGRFHQYQYSLASYNKLADRYSQVDVRFTMRNVPPAFVYECSGPGGKAPVSARVRPSVASVFAGALAAAGHMIRAGHRV